MHIEPAVHDFDYVTIRRSGGILGVDQTLHVDRDLIASVADQRAGDRAFALDAWSAQELMTALSTLAKRRPAASTAVGFDLFHYDVELAYGGTVYRIGSVDLGADEALHGVMFAANHLIDQGPEPFHVMTLHAGVSEPTPA